MKIIKFTEPHSPYKPGDIAGFANDKDAKAYIEAGVAVEYKKGGKKEEGNVETESVEAPVEDKMIKKPRAQK